MSKKSFRIECAVERIKQLRPNASLHFLTLTTPDVCKPWQIAQRWRQLCNSRYWRSLKLMYVQVVEWHPGGHGYHIHVVIDKWVSIKALRYHTKLFGFGRIHILRCDDQKVQKLSYYLAKYLSKYQSECKCAKRTRFTNVSRGLTRLSDIEYQDPCLDFTRSVISLLPADYTCSRYRTMCALGHIYYTFPYHDYMHLAAIGVDLESCETLLDISKKILARGVDGPF